MFYHYWLIANTLLIGLPIGYVTDCFNSIFRLLPIGLLAKIKNLAQFV